MDVSKEWLDAHVEPGGVAGRFRNDAAGMADLATWCRGHGVELAVMEASGGCERLAFLLLWELGLSCALVNARSVRRFAEAMGSLEKTDRIDAAMIARYAQAKRVQPTSPPGAAQQRLQAAGKEKMVIRIALARKLLVILNAKARDARKEFANAT
ncbi:hypothetical protein AU467_33400 [Mesorhizobium loti]|uniref:Transposase IS110-like N-terminal domain-containing protein n=1 Tax=Rhizobium loti TaxID=381 RepID=A0A124GFH2_RHILI|nr:hypothetical protein AU467_33400 [Mesorhizobium loti]